MTNPWLIRFPQMRRLGFSAQLLLGIMVLAVTLALVGGVAVRRVERDYLDSLILSESKHKFELLISASLDDIVSQDIPRIQTDMNPAMAGDPALFSIWIANDKGNVLYGRDRRGVTSQPRLISMSRVIRIEGERFGTISVQWDIGLLERGAASHSYVIAGAIGATCILFGLLGFLAIRTLAVVPIKGMVERLGDFQQGVFNRVTALNGFAPAELQRLDASTNTLGEFLAHKKRLDEELAAAHEAAIAANRTKSEFLANMSHELRTPLNAIIGFSQLIGRQSFGPLGNDKYREYANDVTAAGLHLLDLINDILDVSKIESGKFTLFEEEISIEQLTCDVMRFLRKRAEDAGLHLAQSLPSTLPHVMADERKLKQILLNLLTNAIKFTDRGGSVTLTVMLDDSEDVIIEVADTGIGIPPDKMLKVLEPFGQVENAMTKRHEGAGLGLPLSKGLAELHGGSFKLESRPGIGTRVRFTLPSSRVLRKPTETNNVIQLPGVSIPERGSRALPSPSSQSPVSIG